MEEKQWFLYVVDHHEGPYSAEEVRDILGSGEARDTSYVWREGMEDWMMLSDVPDFGAEGASGEGHGEPVFLTKTGKAAPATSATSMSVSDVKPGDSVFCLNSKRVFSGPHSLKTIIRKLNDGEIATTDTIWHEGWTSFVALSEIAEVMKDYKAPASGKAPKKGAGIKAMGLSKSGANVPKLRIWKSKLFLILIFLVIPVATVHLASKGMIPGVAVGTVPELPLDGLVDTGIQLASRAPEMLAPVADAFSEYLPPFVQEWFSPIPAIENIPEEKMKALREAARTPTAQGYAIATAVAVGDELNPVFHVATNLPDGISLVLDLKGRPGTLINATGFHKTVSIDIIKNYAASIRIGTDGSKPLPRGEYTLAIYEADKQTPEAAQFIAGLPAKKAPAMIPAGKKIISVDSMFLGGKKDAMYKAKLAEFAAKIAAKRSTELAELQQMFSLLESNALDDAGKARVLETVKIAQQRQALWRQHHERSTKMAAQLSATLNKGKEALEKDYVLGDLYTKASALVALWVQTHEVLKNYIEKPGSVLPAQLSQAQTTLSTALNEYKAHLQREGQQPTTAPTGTTAAPAPAGAAPTVPAPSTATPATEPAAKAPVPAPATSAPVRAMPPAPAAKPAAPAAVAPQAVTPPVPH